MRCISSQRECGTERKPVLAPVLIPQGGFVAVPELTGRVRNACAILARTRKTPCKLSCSLLRCHPWVLSSMTWTSAIVSLLPSISISHPVFYCITINYEKYKLNLLKPFSTFPLFFHPLFGHRKDIVCLLWPNLSLNFIIFLVLCVQWGSSKRKRKRRIVK